MCCLQKYKLINITYAYMRCKPIQSNNTVRNLQCNYAYFLVTMFIYVTIILYLLVQGKVN